MDEDREKAALRMPRKDKVRLTLIITCGLVLNVCGFFAVRAEYRYFFPAPPAPAPMTAYQMEIDRILKSAPDYAEKHALANACERWLTERLRLHPSSTRPEDHLSPECEEAVVVGYPDEQ